VLHGKYSNRCSKCGDKYQRLHLELTALPIKWKILDQLEALHLIKNQWLLLFDESSASVFSSPDWVLTWIDSYWQSDWQLQLIVGYEADRLVVVAPLYCKKTHKLPTVTILSPVGQGEPEACEVASEYQDILIARGFEKCLPELADLINKMSFSELYCRALLPEMNWLKLAPLLNFHNIRLSGLRYQTEINAGLLNIFSKNTRQKWNRCRNRLTKQNADFRWLEASQYDEYWQKMADFHQFRWQQKGKSGAFSCQIFSQFHQQFRNVNDGHVKISVIEIAGEAIAINYYVAQGQVLHFYQSGWDEENYTKFSPGFALHIWSMLNTSYRYYDFMMGAENNSYKSQFGCQSVSMFELKVTPMPFRLKFYRLIRKLTGK
jgi:CelD/BcsL family acetyltransferase involved in cellulose biosynthesis